MYTCPTISSIILKQVDIRAYLTNVSSLINSVLALNKKSVCKDILIGVLHEHAILINLDKNNADKYMSH